MARQLVTPVSMNAVGLSALGVLPQAAPSFGIDAAGTGGTAFATAWTGIQGIMFPNNGQCWVYIYCGATPGGAINILQGRKVEGALPPAATFGGTVTASGTFWIPPLSQQDFNQQDSSAFGGASTPGGTSLGGAIGASGVGLTCIDFTTTTTLAVRVYQVSQVLP